MRKRRRGRSRPMDLRIEVLRQRIARLLLLGLNAAALAHGGVGSTGARIARYLDDR